MKFRKMRFVLCLSNEGFEAALELRKIYQQLPDAEAEREGLVRVIDEPGEDHVYPITMLAPISVPERAAKAFAAVG
jgi:hypothetical protein